MNAIILAGGLSTRMGEDKARLRWGDGSLLGHIVEHLRPLARRMLIVCHDVASQEILRQEFHIPEKADRDSFPSIQSNLRVDASKGWPPELEWILDNREERAPIVGVSCGLEASDAEWNAVVACDMPHVSTSLLQYQREKALSEDVDGCFPEFLRPEKSRISTRAESPRLPSIEPLHGVYNRSLRTRFVDEMEQGNFSLSRVLARMSIAVVPWQRCLEFDPSGRFATNVNTPEDLSRAAFERRDKWIPTEGSKS